MKAELIEDAPVLIPNKEHQSFSHSKVILKKGTEVEGEPKIIKGLRKGEPFDYKVFRTEEGQIIFLKNVNLKNNKMTTTEITMGMDAQPQGTVIDLPSHSHKKTIIGGVIGAVLGYAYCHYKKHDATKTKVYVLGGALVGAGIGLVLTKHPLNIKK